MEYCAVDESPDDFRPDGKTFHRLGQFQVAKIICGGKTFVMTSGLAWWGYKCAVPWTPFPGSCGIWTCSYPNGHTPPCIYVRMTDMDGVPATKVLLASYSKIGVYWYVSLHYATTRELWLQMKAPLKETWKDWVLHRVWERAKDDFKENISNQCLLRILVGSEILGAEDRRTMEEIFHEDVSLVKGARKQNEEPLYGHKSAEDYIGRCFLSIAAVFHCSGRNRCVPM